MYLLKFRKLKMAVAASTVSAAGSRYMLRSADTADYMFCQGQELNLVNEVSAVLVQLPGTVLRLICTISLTLKHFKMAQECAF